MMTSDIQEVIQDTAASPRSMLFPFVHREPLVLFRTVGKGSYVRALGSMAGPRWSLIVTATAKTGPVS